MILAKVKAGEKPGEPKFFTPEELINKFTKTVGQRRFFICEELIQWCKDGNGMLGTHFQVNQDMYVKILDKDDDYQKYYNPVAKKVSQSSKPWCAGSCDCDGNCGSGCKC